MEPGELVMVESLGLIHKLRAAIPAAPLLKAPESPSRAESLNPPNRGRESKAPRRMQATVAQVKLGCSKW